MNDILTALYETFYTPLPLEELREENELCYQKLMDLLEKADRSTLMTLVDNSEIMAEKLSRDSFIAGFQLAMRLRDELDHHEMETAEALRRQSSQLTAQRRSVKIRRTKISRI
ncbi:MAG: hypothetical protein IKC03_02600 [Oscillospiraceae bacterium]|nr:hypothetical protein [Oscillospiraceae bacterium]